MEHADLPIEIPFTPVRSSSENSGLVSNYSETTGATTTTSGTLGNANESIASSVLVPPSPQRSFTNPLPPSVTSSPEPISGPNSSQLSPQDVPTTTPLPPKSQINGPIPPDLQTPQFNDAPVKEGDLLGNYAQKEPPQFSVETPEPRVLYPSSDDEETDPTASITIDLPTNAKNDATSTFGKVIQPLKVRQLKKKRNN